MSEAMVSQKMKRGCDGCGKEVEWELVGATEQAINEMQDWYLVIRNVILPDETGRPRFTKVQSNACSLPCVPAAAIKLALPSPANEPEDNIDLASLRAGNVQTN